MYNLGTISLTQAVKRIGYFVLQVIALGVVLNQAFCDERIVIGRH